MERNALTYRRFQSLQFGSVEEFTVEQLAAFCRLVESCTPDRRKKSFPLAGRGVVARGDISGIGRVVVKQYHRGGFIGRLIRSHYFRFGGTRAQAEFLMLRRAEKAGVSVPEPLAAVHTRGFWHRNWLIMREVEGERNLLEVEASAHDALRDLLEEVVRQVVLLIEARIYHVDFHPGNVVVNQAGGVFLIDFDKARVFSGRLNELRDHYLCRWRRAVLKHHLSPEYAELFSLGLRRDFDRMEG